MSKNTPLQKLELTWIGKGDEPKLEPRILIENPEYSYWQGKDQGVPSPFKDGEPTNMLIHGDNLLALKALEQDYTGKVKCIYIDPPYNTGNAFEHYDDGVEHSLWLNLIKPRLEILRNLLTNDGSIWISIDDNEAHYLKVMCDEVFGRQNFIANVIWQKRTSPDNRLRLGAAHDHIIVFGKIPLTHKYFNQLEISHSRKNDFKNPDNDPRGPWASTDCTAQAGHGTKNQFYTLTTPSGRIIELPDNLCWRFTKERMDEEIKEGRIWFGKDGKGVPRKKTYLSEINGQNSWTWWNNIEVGHNQEAKKEIKELFGDNNTFDTPKPERLVERILHLATDEHDLVLDSFLGSGTTAAVAHKMGRRYIGIELGEHAKTHCFPRLRAVIDGEQGGISKSVDWKGGGAFKFYTLAPSLLKQDKFDNWVISQEYNADMLAAAMAKQEGFRYAPDDHIFWKQGKSSEQDYIFTTTQFLTVEALDAIHAEMRPDDNLLICCKSFQKECKAKYPNITIKKIPQMLLGKCEFGKEDYSLNIINMPFDEPSPEATIQHRDELDSVQEIRDKKHDSDQLSLF
jgi:adenine-specific DNA-methyltransferase